MKVSGVGIITAIALRSCVVRQLLIHGGRSVVRGADKHNDPIHQWASKKFKEKGFNKACVAVANKNARMVWAIMAKHAQTHQAA